MQEYANLTGASGVEAFEADPEGQWIAIRFRGTATRPGRTYRYSAEHADITTLIDLALKGQGLSTYIAQMRPDYDARWTDEDR